MPEMREVDKLSGQYTTGHDWDGITELDTPLPRWWVWVWVASIVWSIGYWVVMPAWPLIYDYTRGIWDYSSRQEVNRDIENAKAAQSKFLDKIASSTPAEIENDPELSAFAFASGRSAFAINCSQCHGLGAQGAPGIANLNDDDWIWGGDIDSIYTTIRYGVRSDNVNTRMNEMPGFVRDGLLTEEEAQRVARFVLSLSRGNPDFSSPGGTIFTEQCSFCHGEKGGGLQALGGPRLNDSIWLYGGTYEDILAQVSSPRHGVMPAWEGRLPPEVIKELAVYVHSLGGGEK